MTFDPNRKWGQPPPLPRGGAGGFEDKVHRFVSKLKETAEDVRKRVVEEVRQEKSCPRPGCAEMNPREARFCRRCGVTLSGGGGVSGAM